MLRLPRLAAAAALLRRVRQRAASTSTAAPPPPAAPLSLRTRRLAVAAAVFALFAAARAASWLDAFLLTFDASLAAQLGNAHPLGEGSECDDDADAIEGPAAVTEATTRGLAFTHFMHAGRRVDVCVIGPASARPGAAGAPPLLVVVNAGTVAAARPLLLALSRAGYCAVGYTHGGLNVPRGRDHGRRRSDSGSGRDTGDDEILQALRRPSFDAHGSSLGPFFGLLPRLGKSLQLGLRATGDLLPLHSALLLPPPFPEPCNSNGRVSPTVPTSELQSRELAAVLAHLRAERAVLVSTSYHWLATTKCALRNAGAVAGLVCVDPAFPSTTPRILVATAAAPLDAAWAPSPRLLVSPQALPLTPLERSAAVAISRIRQPVALVGPLLPLLGLPPSSLFAPQQLAPTYADAASRVPSESAGVSEHVSALAPNLDVAAKRCAASGGELYEAAFLRSQVVGGGLGRSGQVPSWTLARQASSGTPLLSRWFGVELGSEQSVEYKGSGKDGLVSHSYELDAAGARSPFLDIGRVAAILGSGLSGSGSFRVGGSVGIDRSDGDAAVASILSSIRRPASAAYSSDGAALGGFVATLAGAFEHRKRAISHGAGLPCPLLDARAAYASQMLEALKAENHFLLLTDQASGVVAAALANLRAPRVPSDAMAAAAVREALASMAALPLDLSCAALSGAGPLKGGLVRIALAQAGVVLPGLGDASIPAPSVEAGPPHPLAVARAARFEALLRAAAALALSGSPSPLLSDAPAIDSKVARLRRQLLPPSSFEGAGGPLAPLSAAVEAYCAPVAWTPPALYSLTPYRWGIPLHALDRFAAAVAPVRPVVLVSASSRQSSELVATATASFSEMLGAVGGATVASVPSSTAAAATAPSLSSISVPAFAGLLSFASANLAGAAKPQEWADSDAKGRRLPFPVSFLVTEQTDQQLLAPSFAVPELAEVAAMGAIPSGLVMHSEAVGMVLPYLGAPSQPLLHMRLLIQAQQRLTAAVWLQALGPGAVSVVPSETPGDVAAQLALLGPQLKGKLRTHASYGWLSLLLGTGEGRVEVEPAAERGGSRPRQRGWPPLVHGGVRGPLDLVSDAVAYGPPQPYRPALSRVVEEVDGCVRAVSA